MWHLSLSSQLPKDYRWCCDSRKESQVSSNLIREPVPDQLRNVIADPLSLGNHAGSCVRDTHRCVCVQRQLLCLAWMTHVQCTGR